ncbi:MAG: Na+:solute symporter [Myxococcales bacterium]|nr:Na+:solute symporter [Myxococcales bacterium]MDH5566207.1 Na+:solute symporter [Myxococcales bacterium]
MPLSWIDAAVLAAFVAYAIGSGLRSRAVASQNLEEYFLAGRSLSGWRAGLSMAATQFAADTPLLVTGLVATAGIFALWQLWIYALAFLLMGFVLAPSWRRAGVLTDAELAELRYAGRTATALRAIKALYFGTLVNCVVLAWVLFAARAIAEPFLVWNAWLPASVYRPVLALVTHVGVPLATNPQGAELWIHSADNLISLGLVVALTLFYSTAGGLRSVVATDTVQLALAMLGTALYTGFVVHHAGGMGAIAAQIGERFAEGGPGGLRPGEILAFTPSRAKDASLALLAVFALQWFIQLNADGTGYLAQRCMACRTDRDAKLASVVFSGVQVLLRSLLWLPIALGLLVIFPPDLAAPLESLRHERELSFVRGIAELLPWGIRGVMLTAMLAALASTVDTHLNWGASYWARDLYERVLCQAWLRRDPDPRSLVWVARAANAGILLVALAVMTQLTSIERAWRIALLLGAGMGPLLVLRWLWWRISGVGEIACIAVSLAAAAPLLAAPLSEAVRLLVMAALASGAGVGASLLTPEPLERLQAFFERAHPPGFWAPVATSLGVDPAEGVRRLARGLAAVAAAALCVFSLLTGLGSWLCSSPAPLWWPLGWGAWIASQLALGCGLVPAWWRLGFCDAPLLAQSAPAKVSGAGP